MCNINPVPDIYSCIGGKMHWHLFTIKPSYLNCMSLVNSNQSQSKTNQLWPRYTWIEGLFQAKGVQDTEGEPDLLGLHLFAVEPVELHRLIDIVVVWHHRVGRDQWPSHAGGCWGHCTLRGRRRLEEEQHFGQGCAKWLQYVYMLSIFLLQEKTDNVRVCVSDVNSDGHILNFTLWHV